MCMKAKVYAGVKRSPHTSVTVPKTLYVIRQSLIVTNVLIQDVPLHYDTQNNHNHLTTCTCEHTAA